MTGFDDIAMGRLLEPALSTVRQPIWEMAEVAVKRLIARVEGEADRGPLRQQWSPEFIRRGSVAPPPGKQPPPAPITNWTRSRIP